MRFPGNGGIIPVEKLKSTERQTENRMEKNLQRILPVPKQIVPDAENRICTLPPVIAVKEEAFLRYAEVFSENLWKTHGLTLTQGEGGICLLRDETLAEEACRIECRPDGIFLYAGEIHGIGNALVTLLQFAEVENGVLSVPACTITDAPDCAYRAVMVDLPASRSMEQMEHYADLCYLYKIRYLHLHLADNGGYCLPSRRFPKLPTPGMHFTFEQVEHFRRYCADRNVEIIPEIDVPGHTTYLTAAYPEWFCDTLPDGAVRKDLICVGKPGMMEHLRELFGEVMELFPESRYFHIGGDEAAIDTWNDCRDCRAYMEAHGIPDVKALYTHFIKITTDMVLEMGKIPVVWEGFPKEGAEEISRDVVVTAWESLYHLPNELLEEGFTITNSSWMPLYVVHPNSYHAKFVKGGRWYPKDILEDWNVYTWKNWWDKSAAYEKPIVVEPTEQVIGGTYCVWLTDYAVELPVVRENLPAMCERLWNVNSTLTAAEFEKRLAHVAALGDRL